MKSILPFQFKEGEKLMCVIFQCTDDQTIHYPMICKNTQIFNTLENSLYENMKNIKKLKIILFVMEIEYSNRKV